MLAALLILRTIRDRQEENSRNERGVFWQACGGRRSSG